MSKGSKQRHCPATGRTISPAECGENRHSRYACPPECPCNPFSPEHYTALLETEDRLDATIFKRMLTEDTGAAEALASAARRSPGHGLHAASGWRLFFLAAPDGSTLTGRLATAGFPGLKNDERVLLSAKMQTRVALLEIRQVLDGQTVDAVDLLEPGRPIRRFIDRQIAARATRFSVILTWSYPLPHFWRVSGTGIMMPEFAALEQTEVLQECIVHLGGPAAPGVERTRWLAENFIRLDETITAAGFARRQRMFANLDAQFGAATYELTAPFKACRAALVADPEVAPDDLSPEEGAEGLTEAMVCFENDAAAGRTGPAGPEARRVKGRILLGKKQWRVEAFGGARFVGLRAQFEARMGALVRFTKERLDDLGARVAAEDPPVDTAAVPPRLLEQPLQMDLQSSLLPGPPPGVSLEDYLAHLAAQHSRALLDTPLPALDGVSPREAAGLPALRPKLLHLMKSHVRQLDEANLRTGRSDDINALLRELGLVELDVPPPPPRAIPPDDDDGDEPDDGYEDDDEADDVRLPPEPGRPAAPRLIGAPLTYDLALHRLEEVMQSLANATAGLDELDMSGSTLIQDVEEFSESWMTESEFNYLVTFLIQAWFVLVPKGVRAPELRFEAMEDAIGAAEAQLRSAGRKGMPPLETFVQNCRQPGLLLALTGGIVEAGEKAPRKMRPSPQAMIGMTFLLKVLLDELDHALRA